MTPINEVSVGKFVRFAGNIVYVCKNNFDDAYTLVPIEGKVPQDKFFDSKVYVYKRVQKHWVRIAKEWIEVVFNNNKLDNLSYVENLDILKSYGI